MKTQLLYDEKISNAGKIAVCQVSLPKEAVVLAKRLLENEIYFMEIAYRDLDNFDMTDECIRAVRDEVPEMKVGAATVINRSIAKRAIKAGAQFILSPGLNPCTVKYCKKHDVPVYPGVCTPSEIEAALELGLTLLKFFPAEANGGIPFLKALKSPYPSVRFIVSGGINGTNAEKYMDLENVACVSGSWLSSGLL